MCGPGALARQSSRGANIPFDRLRAGFVRQLCHYSPRGSDTLVGAIFRRPQRLRLVPKLPHNLILPSDTLVSGCPTLLALFARGWGILTFLETSKSQEVWFPPSFLSNSASAVSSICRCRGLHATCSCCRIRCRDSSSPCRLCRSATCSGVSTSPCSFFDAASSCCCSTDLLSHPGAILDPRCNQANFFSISDAACVYAACVLRRSPNPSQGGCSCPYRRPSPTG